MPKAAKPKIPKNKLGMFRPIVKRAMQAQDHNYTQLAEAVGMSRCHLTRWCRGLNPNLGTDKLEKILNHLGIKLIEEKR